MRKALVALAVLVPLAALANGAMGLGLEIWSIPIWACYVVVMVVAEAWLIGRWLGLSWWASLGLSAGANFMTGAGCGLGGCPFLHEPIVGSRTNPNPLINSLAILAIFSIPSAFIESILWSRFRGVRSEKALVLRALWVHLALVPLGFGILLIPARPYEGSERVARTWNNFEVRRVKTVIAAYISDRERIPMATTPSDLQAETSAYSGKPLDFDLALTTPSFGRFATDGRGGTPWEFNPALRGLKLTRSGQGERWTWYLRPRERDAFTRQIAVDLNNGNVDYTYDERRLKDLPRPR